MINNIYLIAEIGINHNGDLKIAKKLIDNAKEANHHRLKFARYSHLSCFLFFSLLHTIDSFFFYCSFSLMPLLNQQSCPS